MFSYEILCLIGNFFCILLVRFPGWSFISGDFRTMELRSGFSRCRELTVLLRGCNIAQMLTLTRIRCRDSCRSFSGTGPVLRWSPDETHSGSEQFDGRFRVIRGVVRRQFVLFHPSKKMQNSYSPFQLARRDTNDSAYSLLLEGLGEPGLRINYCLLSERFQFLRVTKKIGVVCGFCRH